MCVIFYQRFLKSHQGGLTRTEFGNVFDFLSLHWSPRKLHGLFDIHDADQSGEYLFFFVIV